jgi:hypothetical protein
VVVGFALYAFLTTTQGKTVAVSSPATSPTDGRGSPVTVEGGAHKGARRRAKGEKKKVRNAVDRGDLTHMTNLT